MVLTEVLLELAAPPSSTVGGEGAQALSFHHFSQQKDDKKRQFHKLRFSMSSHVPTLVVLEFA